MDKFDQKWVIDSIRHRRMLLFWAAVVIFLPLPWLLKGCSQVTTRSSQTYVGCSVLSIHDGDTMTVRCSGQKLRVRLYCIDAPEMKQKPWGTRSRDHLRAVTPSIVRLVIWDRDRYGREIAEVFDSGAGGRNLNLIQVAAGQAAVYKKYCTDKDYEFAEDGAKREQTGIWARSGLQQAPWKFRH